jgi:hypothetical protein
MINSRHLIRSYLGAQILACGLRRSGTGLVQAPRLVARHKSTEQDKLSNFWKDLESTGAAAPQPAENERATDITVAVKEAVQSETRQPARAF